MQNDTKIIIHTENMDIACVCVCERVYETGIKVVNTKSSAIILKESKSWSNWKIFLCIFVGFFWIVWEEN